MLKIKSIEMPSLVCSDETLTESLVEMIRSIP
jgi:hypothetical protein